jgi:SAM domain (Sterile alpha motif)
MSEIRRWLEGIGLVQYADIFESNDLDIDLLQQVDDQTLKDIGIFSAGHRLRIRSAIAKLSSEATLGKHEHASDAANRPPVADVEIRQPRPSAVAGATPVSAAAEVAGERRYLTVMFATWLGRPPFPHNSMPKNGATLLAPISMPLQPQSWRWAAMLPSSCSQKESLDVVAAFERPWNQLARSETEPRRIFVRF